MLEYSLRTFKKKGDEGLCLTKIAAPNGDRADIERNRPARCLFMSDLHRFRDALLGFRFGVVRTTSQPQCSCENGPCRYPVVDIVRIQSNPRHRRQTGPQGLFDVLLCATVLPEVAERPSQDAVTAKFRCRIRRPASSRFEQLSIQ